MHITASIEPEIQNGCSQSGKNTGRSRAARSTFITKEYQIKHTREKKNNKTIKVKAVTKSQLRGSSTCPSWRYKGSLCGPGMP